jgi:O-acetylhomoserine/O-acetylserine sulfhydrylase-like pyridoxal-dependent enzyme
LKFLNGHGTAIGGVLLGKDLEKMNTTVWKWHSLMRLETVMHLMPFFYYLYAIKTLSKITMMD